MERPPLLLIEDNATSRMLARKVLSEAGYAVYEARDGESALALVERHRPQLIILDLQLRSCDAFALAERLRDVADGDTRWCALCGLAPDEALTRIWASGFHDIIAKPVEPARLRAAVESQLAFSNARRAAPRESLERAPTELGASRELLLRSAFLSAELAVLNALSHASLGRDEVEGALLTALAACFDASGCSLGGLYLADRYQQLRMRPLGPFSGDDLRALSSFFGEEAWLRELLQRGHPRMMMLDVGDPERAAGEVLARARASCGLVVPLISGGVPLGALFMAVREDDQHGDLERCRDFVLAIAGQVVHVLAMAETLRSREVAEREAEQQRRLAREQAAVLRALVECAPDLIVHLDRAGKVRFSNRPLASESEQQPGGSWYEAMAPEYRDEMRAALAAVLRDGVAKTIETRTTGANGATARIESHIGPIRSGSEIVGAVVIQRDVSHKKQVDAQLMIADRLASVGSLAAGIAHEINNPLASVMANLDLALHEVQGPNSQASADLREELHDARAAADRVRSIVRDLRVFARGDESRLRTVEIDKVLDSAVRLAGVEVRPRARLLRHYEPVPAIACDQARLGQVFFHLIVSAAHSVEPGRADHHELAVAVKPDGQHGVVIEIGDSGMSPGVLDTPIDPELATATGIGLAMCHRVVSSLGGSIYMRTEPGRITGFRVQLPARAEGTGPAAGATHATFSNARFLIVAADPQLARNVRQALRTEHDVLALPEPGQALARLRAGERFAAIVCDILRQPTSGMDFYAQLARAYPEQAQRVLFVTEEGLAADAARLFEGLPNLRIDRSVRGSELEAILRAFVH